MNQKYFGESISDWDNSKVIRPKYKIMAISMITLSLGYSVIFQIKILFIKLLLILLGIILIRFIYKQKSYK